MGSSNGRLSVDEANRLSTFFTDLARKPVSTQPTSSGGGAPSSGVEENGVRWITEGVSKHRDFILNDVEERCFDADRLRLVQELIDLNPETRRIELILHLCSMGIDQAICNTTPGGGRSATSNKSSNNSSSSGGVAVSAAASSSQQPIVLTHALPQMSIFLQPLMRLLTLILRHAVASAQGDSLLLSKLIDRTVASSNSGNNNNASSSSPISSSSASHAGKATRVCQLLIEFTVRIPLDQYSLDLHREVMLMLLGLFSTQLYHPAVFEEQRMDTYVELVLASDILKPFFATVIQRVVAWGVGLLPETSYVYRSGYQPGFKNLFNFFGAFRNEHCASSTDILGRHSAQVLCLLILHQRGNGMNHAAECFRQLTHGDFIDFEMLLITIQRKVVSAPCLAGMLYVLLLDHPTFLHACLSNWPGQLAEVVHSLLQLAAKTAPLDYSGHYDSPQHSASTRSSSSSGPSTSLHVESLSTRIDTFQNVFVQIAVATILCILSRDRVYHELAFTHVVAPTFIAERYVKAITVGSLTLAVCSKAVARALQEKDDGLARLYLAAIENASPFAAHLDAYSSQRLLGLLTTLLKRLHKLEYAIQAKRKTAVSSSSSSSLPVDPCYELLAEREALLAPVKFLSESFLAMLEGKDRGNSTLTYELLYNRQIIYTIGASAVDVGGGGGHVSTSSSSTETDESAARREQEVQNILRPLREVIDCYEAELASVAVNHSPEDILTLIERVANSTGTCIAGDMMTSDDGTTVRTTTTTTATKHLGRELLYLYQESREANHFFTPFVWATMVSEGNLPGAVPWTSDEDVSGGCFALFYPPS